jgi:tellurite methyltransferase
MPNAESLDLASTFGSIDIYLFDQLLRQRIRPGMRVFDAGCGGGRNLIYLLQAGYDVRRLAASAAPSLPKENFRAERIDAHSFADASADVVISSAVLHFARDDDEFRAMLEGSWRVVAPGGLFFCRLASSIGIEGEIRQVSGRRHHLPDGSERYLVDEAMLLEWTGRLGGELADPIKTTVVAHRRSMTTWVVRRLA